MCLLTFCRTKLFYSLAVGRGLDQKWIPSKYASESSRSCSYIFLLLRYNTVEREYLYWLHPKFVFPLFIQNTGCLEKASISQLDYINFNTYNRKGDGKRRLPYSFAILRRKYAMATSNIVYWIVFLFTLILCQCVNLYFKTRNQCFLIWVATSC